MPLTRPVDTNHHGFFSSQVSTANHLDNTHAFVDVGGCCIRAVAAGLIDVFLNHPREHAELLNHVLTSHFRWFPSHRSTLPGLVTPTERIQQLVADVPGQELVYYMAVTLRQFAITEMNMHHLRYRDAFIGHSVATSIEEMRKHTTWVDPGSLIAALAKVLAIGIEVREVGRVKVLPKRSLYTSASAGRSIVVLQLQDGHYTPRITVSDRFTSQLVRTLPYAIHSVAHDHSLSEIQDARAMEDKRLVEVFAATYKRLYGMVNAGELHKKALLDIYIKGMPTQDNLSEDVACVGLEHGTQRIFDEMLRLHRPIHKESLSVEDGQHVEHEVVHALARDIAIGRRSAEHVFAQIDELQYAASRSTV